MELLLTSVIFFPALAALGSILSAVYLLWIVQRVACGPVRQARHGLPDLSWREAVTLVPLLALVFWMGLYPAPLLKAMHAGVTHVVEQVDAAARHGQLNAIASTMGSDR